MNPAYCDDDQMYIRAEEGRYGLYDDDDIMNEGIAAIDIDEMNEEETWCKHCGCIKYAGLGCFYDIHDSEPVATDEDDKQPTKNVFSDPCVGDYETPEDAKTRGGENYHINKQKTKRPSPKSERRKIREKRVNDLQEKASRCHKRAVVHDM